MYRRGGFSRHVLRIHSEGVDTPPATQIGLLPLGITAPPLRGRRKLFLGYLFPVFQKPLDTHIGERMLRKLLDDAERNG